MVLPSGICDVTAIADGYANKTVGSVTVYGGDVSWADIAMQSGLSDPSATSTTGDGGSGGSYGCFISTAACESHPWLKGPVRIIHYLMVGLACLLLSATGFATGVI